MLTNEMLDEKIALLEKQKEEHFAVYHQAVGAISAIQHLKTMNNERKPFSKDHLTLDQLGQALGGKVEAIEPL